MSDRSRMVFVLGLLLGMMSGMPRALALVMDAQGNQTIKTFRNVSGATVTSGTAVIFAYGASDVSTGSSKGATSSLGLDVTTTTSLDRRDFAGVTVDDSCTDGTLCNTVVYGPALARFACNTDNATDASALVGTSAQSGQLGAGSRAGFLLSLATAGTVEGTSDNCLKWVFVEPGISSTQ